MTIGRSGWRQFELPEFVVKPQSTDSKHFLKALYEVEAPENDVGFTAEKKVVFYKGTVFHKNLFSFNLVCIAKH